jgi:thiosulfate dehydrogenase
MNKDKINIGHFRSFVKSLVFLFTAVLFLVASLFLLLFYHTSVSSWIDNNHTQVDTLYVEAEKKLRMTNEVASFWTAADINLVTDEALKQELEYGKDLISHTARYLGPNGSVKKITNGMSCSNCHLDAGTKAWGNNYGSVFSTYPKMRGRSGQIEGVYKRINDCLERSLNGSHLNEEDKEMQAMIAYIEYIGKDVPKGEEAKASGIYDLEFLDRAADPTKGKTIYDAKCASCHQVDGQGVLAEDKKEYTYPPLWGANSYNSGAGLYRISRFAGYVKYNMPLGATYESPLLTDEESWDLAAYVNNLARPSKDLSKDWPNISKKAVDHPFGPFSDTFSETQHKFGPFKPIKEQKKKDAKK